MAREASRVTRPPASPPDASDVAPTDAARRPSALRILLLIVLAAAGLLAAQRVGAQLPAWAEQIRALGYWGPLVFILAYAAAVVLFVPGALLTLAGGALFGLPAGTAYVFVAAVLGSAGAFLVSRHLARSWVEGQLARSPRFAAVDRAVAARGLTIMFLLRLSPAFPFNFLNYALGLTRVSLRDYLLASFGMLPGTLLYVYYGVVIGDVAALAGGAAPERGAAGWIVMLLGLAATVALTTWVTRLARRALAETRG
jgi:uncharacterized membrane protein YdjX (TVP38/TMEM64 family)